MTTSFVPWLAPLNILGSLHTGDAFTSAFRLVLDWLSAHGRNPSDARLQAVVDLRDLLKKDPRRLGELQKPMVSMAIHHGELASIASVIMAQLNMVIEAVPKIPLDRFVTACSIELGSQLWMLAQCNDELSEHGGAADDNLQMMRESMFGVIKRCCGKPPAAQLRLMMEHLSAGMEQLEHLSKMLKDRFAAEQEAQPTTITISDGQAAELLSHLNGGHPNA